jgi:hypothetical protein
MVYEGTHLGEPDLLAWIGEDEHGSGRIGIKQARVLAGMIPIVGVADDKTKLTWPAIREQMQRQADAFGKTIRLVRYEAVEEITVVRPRGHG